MTVTKRSPDQKIGRSEYLFIAVVDLLLIVVEKLAKTLEVNYLALAQELYYLVYIGIIAQAENIVVSRSRLLLCCQYLKATCEPRKPPLRSSVTAFDARRPCRALGGHLATSCRTSDNACFRKLRACIADCAFRSAILIVVCALQANLG